MNASRGNWEVIKEVRQDVIKLFKLFSSTNSLRYEDFCKVWKQLNFSLVFSRCITLYELLEFTEDLIQVIKNRLLPAYEFSTRVAALYTLYGLYFKQPIIEGVKIKVTKSEWKEITAFISLCKAEKHYDVVFIHLKLYVNDAYSFSVTEKAVGLEKGFRKYPEKSNTLLPSNYDVNLLYRPLISQQLVTSLTALESLYCKKKLELFGEKNLVFIDDSFAKSLENDLRTYSQKCQKYTYIKHLSDVWSSKNEQSKGTDAAKVTSDSEKNTEAKESDNSTGLSIIKRKDQLGTQKMKLLAKRKAEKLMKNLTKKHRENKLKSSKYSLTEINTS